MKRILAAAALAALLIAPFSRAGTVGGYPNATSPLNGTERMLSDQSSSGYPCIACTVDITPLQLSDFTALQATNYALMFNNNGVIGSLIPSATGQYCLDWASLTAAPTLVTCTTGSGTVTSFAFTNGNGFTGTVTNATTTPTLSLAPSFTGFAYSNGTGFSAASTTGSGNLVLANSPTLVTPNLGTPSAINLLNGLGLPFSGLATGTLTTGTLTIGTGATLTYSGTGVLNANQIGSLPWPTPISGDCLTTNGTTLSWGTCGAGTAITLQTGGTNNASQAALNLVGVGGVSVTNPSGGTVDIGPVTEGTNPQTGTSYTISTSDCGQLVALDNAAAIAVSLPPATGSFSGCQFDVDDYGAGTATITAVGLGAPTQATPTTATTGGSLPASTTYYLAVTATNGNGQTSLSAVQSIATGSGTATNTVTASWTAIPAATGYTVWISTSTITGGEATVAYSTAASTATSATFTAIPGTTATTPSADTTASTIDGLTSVAAVQYRQCTFNAGPTGAMWHLIGCTAQVSGGGGSGITLENGGTSLGTVTTLNCSTGTTCTAASGVGTLTASGGTGTPENIQTFTASGTWTKPSGSPQSTWVSCTGGGGGGASGALEPSGTASPGGGGGGGASTAQGIFSTALLPATVAVTIGAGGTGGAALTADGVGNNGTNGTPSTFGTYLTAFAGGYGQGGTLSGGSIGGGGAGLTANANQSSSYGVCGASGSTGGGEAIAAKCSLSGSGGSSSAAGQNGGVSEAAVYGGAGGGSGGGIAVTPANTTGISGSSVLSASGGTAGSGNGNGDSGSVASGVYTGASGGGGGGGAATGNGGAGGNGGTPGGGGGGGGAALGTNSSGAGGRGGNGYCVAITSY